MQAHEYLLKDKALAKAIAKVGPLTISPRENVFLQLIRSVAGQQLSTKAAASIFKKFLKLLGKKKPNPQNIITLSIEDLRTVGFSYNKAAYLHNIAAFWKEHKLSDNYFTDKSNEEIIALLTQIKGVGKWTVEMLLMFTLAREEVFAVDDLGIQQGMASLYKWEGLPLKELKIKMLAKAKTYSPYATYACMYIWRWKDDV
jgi:DNA-3-methyladenine glycosylase II